MDLDLFCMMLIHNAGPTLLWVAKMRCWVICSQVLIADVDTLCSMHGKISKCASPKANSQLPIVSTWSIVNQSRLVSLVCWNKHMPTVNYMHCVPSSAKWLEASLWCCLASDLPAALQHTCSRNLSEDGNSSVLWLLTLLYKLEPGGSIKYTWTSGCCCFR